MTKLTDTQLIVLSKAAAREDGCGVLPEGRKAAGALKAGARLVDAKLMKEVRAKPDMPVWRRDGENRAFSLVLTAAGQKAIKADEDEAEPAGAGKRGIAALSEAEHGAFLPPGEPRPLRETSKQALVVRMLSSEAGASLDALVQATGWLPHTTRAALTGLRKRGFVVDRAKNEAGTSVYRIIEGNASVSSKRSEPATTSEPVPLA